VSADPSLLSLVHDSSEARVTVRCGLAHRCPQVEDVDVGTVTISWRCTDVTLELHSLAAYLATWENQKISSEEITMQIRNDLSFLDGLEEIEVSTTWQTAGFAVLIEA
jgi:NADPH-dependent 7-cyano-7-deazaguanine reductase QueF